MDHKTVEEYVLSMPGAVLEYPFGESVAVYKVGDKMFALIREGKDFLNEVSDDQARDAGLVAMAQRMEHYGMAGYGSARTYALHLDYDNAAQQLQQTLDEEAQVDERMTELAESTLNLEAVA